jgi:MFS transporter, DHA1 family, tetracycline resistance protein
MPNAEPLERTRASQGRGRSPLAVLFLTVFIDLLGFGIVIPFLPMYAARLHVGALGIGLILSIYSLGQFLCAPLLGRLSDHFGRRPIIMLGLFGSSLSYLIYGFAGSFALLIVSRAVHGVCAGTVSTAQAYIADTTAESERAHGMGLIGAAFGLGFVLGPGIGGLLGHTHLRLPVFFAAALTFANLIFATLALPESHRPQSDSVVTLDTVLEPIVSLPRQLTRHRLSRWFALAFLATFAMAAFETTFALLVPRLYGYGAGGTGGLMAFAGLVQVITQGYLLRKVIGLAGELRLIRYGMILFAIGIAPMASIANLPFLFVLLAMLSGGYGLANPSIASLISRRTEPQLQGEVLGVNQSALALARIFGPIVAGVAYQMLSPATTYVGAGLVALAAFILSIETAIPTNPRKERPSR